VGQADIDDIDLRIRQQLIQRAVGLRGASRVPFALGAGAVHRDVGECGDAGAAGVGVPAVGMDVRDAAGSQNTDSKFSVPV
jgi:hypothetical protein